MLVQGRPHLCRVRSCPREAHSAAVWAADVPVRPQLVRKSLPPPEPGRLRSLRTEETSLGDDGGSLPFIDHKFIRLLTRSPCSCVEGRVARFREENINRTLSRVRLSVVCRVVLLSSALCVLFAESGKPTPHPRLHPAHPLSPRCWERAGPFEHLPSSGSTPGLPAGGEHLAGRDHPQGAVGSQ